MPESFVPAAINAAIAFAVSGGNPFAAAVAFASTFVLTAVAKSLAKEHGGGWDASAQGSLQSIRQPIAPWEVVLGRTRKGGVLTFRWISADRSQWHMVITLACHRCQAIDAIIFDNEVVPLDANGNATGRFA